MRVIPVLPVPFRGAFLKRGRKRAIKRPTRGGDLRRNGLFRYASRNDGATAVAEHTDMTAHTATYGRVIALLKWGALACFFLALSVVWLIA